MPAFIQITTTAGNRDEAGRIAAALVQRRLAGCVQIIGPVHSVYRWQDEVEAAEEWLLLIKTSVDHYKPAEIAIRELHSYACPEVIAMSITQGSPEYLNWLGEQL